ncbi:hypothetical protein MCAMS1_02765 [biofilm metagenome]
MALKYYLLLIVLVVLIIIPFYEHDNSYSCRYDPGELSAEITQGRVYYFRVFVECRAVFNEDELDELYRAAGLFLKKKPEEFLKVISEFNIEGHDLKNLLTMLPLTNSGTIDQKHAELKERIQLVQALADSKTKPKVLGILVDALTR